MPLMTADGGTADHEAAEWLIALREEPDDEALRARFTAWLEADPRHADAWAEMNETARIITSAPPARRGDDLPASADRGTRPDWSRWWPAAAAAAIACLALIVALPMLRLRLAADHLTGVGQVETFTLTDESVVELGPASAIAVDYRPEGRTVRLLSGQAMFEVRSDPARPFRVLAGDLTATALGTGFDVRMIGDATSVAVRHGRVRVDDRRATPVASRELAAGEWARVAPGLDMQDGSGAGALVGAWRTGRVPIRNRRIADGIDEARPWYGGRIVLADEALGARLVTGTYDFHDPVRGLGLLVAPYGGRIWQITPWLIVVTGP
jgi:transmembrane sensor